MATIREEIMGYVKKHKYNVMLIIGSAMVSFSIPYISSFYNDLKRKCDRAIVDSRLEQAANEVEIKKQGLPEICHYVASAREIERIIKGY